jgi:ABC-type transport system involved in cytochrome c biogenesis permease component
VTVLAASTFLQVLLATLILVPVIILWFTAVVDVIHRGSGPKIAGVLVAILVFPILGPLVYFALRKPEQASPEALYRAEADLHREAAGRAAGGWTDR